MDGMQRNQSLGADSIDWADATFNTADFQDSMLPDSPWVNSALNDFTNLADYSDSPAALGLRTPSQAAPDVAGPRTQQRQPALPQDSSMSTESSSADSGSDTSGRHKRKTTSESPRSNQGMGNVVPIKEESVVNVEDYGNMGAFQQTFTQPMPRLAVDQDMTDNDGGIFDFNSAASSPNLPRDFTQQLSLDAKQNLMAANAPRQFAQESPVQTINPGMFTLGGSSRDQSPVTNSAMFNAASPNAIFSTPSSDSNEPFNAAQNWGANMANPAWATDFASQFASPSGLNFTPSPVTNGGTQSMSRSLVQRSRRSKLHIAPISAKSRVETQINVVMTLETPPPGIEHLHLPLHTIAKSKLLAKEDYDQSKVLELHTMLVCSSAMHNPGTKERALQRAAVQNNDEIQQRAEQERDSGEEEKNNIKNVEESEKPSNGGEVRICNNCIQRERKRAGRKKLKKEEEQQHWERYETERVVVFNSSEYLPFKPFEQRDQPQKEGGIAEEPYDPPPGAISASAAMRIACYCRHQSEKEGFQVIFTIKDQQGNVVGQQMSDSILITDDHKTHPPTLTPMTSDMLFQPSQLQTNANGLQTSYSMMDLSSHSQPFHSSRSAGNLQALGYTPQLQFNPHSHVHQLSNAGFVSQGTSATMTPTNLSRPGSPTSAGQAGPNKKRKSASFHKRVPSGLQMTPRVDTAASQPPSATLSSGISMSQFSPTRGVFGGGNDSSFMTIPNNNGPAQYFGGSGPPTPANDNSQFQFGHHPHQLDIARAQNAAYFSHPSSAVPSRSNSPVLQHSRQALSAFPRNPIQTPTNQLNQLNRPPQIFGGQASAGAAGNDGEQAAVPTITKITPTEGPIAGGTEVSVFGYNFTHATQIRFGDSVAPTTFYGSQSILAISPPGRPGVVRVTIVNGQSAMQLQYPSTQGNNAVFTYKDTTNPQMMEMALRFLSQQQTGDPGHWVHFTNEVANKFMQTSISPAGIQGQGYGGSNLMACKSADVEEIVLKVLDLVDASESPRVPCYDLRSQTGQTMLSLACAGGMHQVAAALLARGANPDVRDAGGYTPLMHAAMHERSKTFQLLLMKGADPTMRSLGGDVAFDLVPEASRGLFKDILSNTQRSRRIRPSLHSFDSHSSKLSWDISSASCCETETESSEHAASDGTGYQPALDGAEPSPLSPSAAMMVWRDALSAQIQQFQQNVNRLSNLQLPTMPPLPDYHDNAMVRRLSSLVPGRSSTPMASLASRQSSLWDMFSCPSPSAAPPPAYADLFPESLVKDQKKGDGIQAAFVDAIADEKCAAIFEEPSEISTPSSCSLDADSQKRLVKFVSPSWIWIDDNTCNRNFNRLAGRCVAIHISDFDASLHIQGISKFYWVELRAANYDRSSASLVG